MNNFKLINSLISPPASPIVEAEEPAAPQPTEYVEIDDVDRVSGPRGGSEFYIQYNVHVTYHHPSIEEEGLHLTVSALLDGSYSVEDDSFSYEYGSERGVHGGKYDAIDGLSWSKVTIPHIEDNIEFFKLAPEQATHVSQMVVGYLSGMSSDDIEKLVDVETLVKLVKPEPDFDEPDVD